MLKTFNIDEAIYEKFSHLCREHGVSMSRQVQFFMASQVEHEPAVRKEYIKKLDRIRKGKFIRVTDFAKRYGV